ncbi:glutathione hydrolase 1 proenzyme-like isoform X2 [Sitodiplosis mosellana]|uniref:glutathione hydrolase 1 proenzyme-like isoform X2 n=1 Tax=Sitodiplosis mosellana TaxID=263140 RepID=UPI0024443DC8|nr:glutathione hydrolase 1 proenzyme-like isoform X2 [Sitodiplosis mosellana]XP_055314833.1 glutathione hydrolase 1 proenzyme-like isoform X2 [Sitodiplosis mosellana]XP_055314834.1 glutathione hydrolase 1 proenzyme-like isoform X2 [Sitodiplosis mosellana]
MATIQIESTTPLAENFRPTSPPKKWRSKRRRSCLQWWKVLPPTYKFFLILVGLVVLLVAYMYLQKLVNYVRSVTNDGQKPGKVVPNPEYPLPPSHSILHQFKNGAVCSDAEQCSKIGSDFLDRGGNIFDAAIATLFCNGIATAQSMGIGGGFLMNLYIHSEGKAYTLNSKEMAPLNATEDMFKTPEEYLNGPLSVAVPGEVKGYWELYQRFASKRFSWKELVEPTIKVCESELKLSKHMSDNITPRLLKDNHLRRTFFVNGTNTPRREGEYVRFAPELCNTYKLIAENGGNDFYNGTLAALIADDLRDLGSIVTKKDLESYRTQWEESLTMPINDNTVYVTPTGGGPLVAFILNILREYNMTRKDIETEDDQIRTYHRFIESFKYAFGYRTQLNNSDTIPELVHKMLSSEFANQIREKIDDNHTSDDPKHYGGDYKVIEDKGTSHVSILAPNGDAISVTSSIDLYWGIGQSGKRTGIIFNNAMNDFAVKSFKNYFDLPASPGNHIAPQKRPISSMSPTIVTDGNGDVRLVIGAAGGTKIPTAISTVIARLLWFEQDIKEAVDAPRIHHQLAPMEVQYEYGNIQKLITGLELLGHKMHRYEDRGSVICAIAKNQTGIFANADYRKAGEVVGL